MADAVVAPADLWVAHYSEAALLMPCSYHLNGHSVHQGRAPQRVNSLLVEGGIDGKGYRCSVPPLTVILLRSLPSPRVLQLSQGAGGRVRVPSSC